MKRRGFLLLGLASLPALALAQTSAKVRRIGWLTGGSPKSHARLLEAFRAALRERGWVEGTNIVLELRWAEGRMERLPELAAELVRLKPDVIVTAANLIHLAVRKETATIPIVMATGSDPIASGLVASLARPGGNVTGLTGMYEATPVKMIELAAALVPRGARVTVLVDQTSPFYRGAYRAEFERGAEAFGLQVNHVAVGSEEGLAGALAALGKSRPAIVIMPAGAMFFALGDRVVARARDFRLPVICAFEEWVEAGVLMSYAIDIPESYRRAASYVDRILRGAKPGELPIEQPTRLSLAVNLKTAKQLGIAIPAAVLARADRVVE